MKLPERFKLHKLQAGMYELSKNKLVIATIKKADLPGNYNWKWRLVRVPNNSYYGSVQGYTETLESAAKHLIFWVFYEDRSGE